MNYLETDVDAQRIVLPAGTETLTGHHSKTFYDPILLTRLTYSIEDKWLFQFRADLGGFGIGSDFTWQLQAYADYQIGIQFIDPFFMFSSLFCKFCELIRLIIFRTIKHMDVSKL